MLCWRGTDAGAACLSRTSNLKRSGYPDQRSPRGDKRIPFNYNDVLNGKNLKQNIELEPGDTIIVK